jgi:cell division protein FtsI/penicillin-binding protein 2
MPGASRPTRRRPLPRPAAPPPEPSPEARAAQLARLEQEERAVMIKRLRVLAGVFVLFVVVVLAQLVVAQVLKRPQQVSAQTVDTSRGRIVDRDGTLLATDAFLYEIYLNPTRYHREKFPPEKSAPLIGVTVEALETALAQNVTAVQLTRNATKAQCDNARRSKDVSGYVWCDEKRRRSYPLGPIGAHLIGFANASQTGQTGVEAFYNEWLLTDGEWPSDQLTGSGEPIPQDWQLYLPSRGGRDLVLNMSAPLQYSAEKRLVEALAKYEAKGGSIIVMEARTGAVLAMATWPTFDLNLYNQAEAAAWQNPAVGLLYEPGSIFKIVTYGAALDTRTMTPDQQFNDTGSYEVVPGANPIRNSQKRKLGLVTGWQALGESLNTVSADLAIQMGPEAFYRYVALFGFGRPTEIDLRAEAPGMVKRYGTEQWNLVDQATNSFGQAISVTPIQMINAVAAVANDGALVQPQVAQSLVLNGQAHRLPVRKLEQVMTPETARMLARMMVYTVDNYEAGKKLAPGYKVAGKTGTAEIPEQAGYTNPLTITSFVGFLPAADPRIVVLVKIDEPKKSRWAEQVALPVFGNVARDAIAVLGIPPNGDTP